MFTHGRNLFPYIALALLVAATAWALSFGTLPPADFTFCNETEIKSVDPAIVTGVPEARIVMALYEGLVNWDPKTLAPIPGVAESWEFSPDKREYTYHLRHNAQWSDGTPLTAHDFYYSWQRVLDPKTASEYVYQLSNYMTNAKKYNAAEVAIGDPVEVELKNTDPNLPGARGKVIKGKLVKLEAVLSRADPKTTINICTWWTRSWRWSDLHIYTVRIGDRDRRFCTEAEPDTELCEQVLLDFDQVGIKVIDDYTLQVTINDPTPYFLMLSGFQTLMPVNRKCVETYGYPAWTKPGHIVTNGAYSLKFRYLRDRIRLEKNPHYWNRESVQLGVVDALCVSADTTALNLYLTGKVDWITTVPSTAIPKLLADKRTDFQPATELATEFYRINVTKPPMDNPKVRRALGLAVNRPEIISTVTRMNEPPAYSFVPPSLPGYAAAECPPENVVEARRLLAEAGYPEGKGFPKIELLYNEGGMAKPIAELLQNRWQKNLGISFELKKLEWTAYLTAQRELDYSVSRSGWTGDYLDPMTFLGIFVTGGTDNYTGWGNPEYDQLIQDATKEPDVAKRFALLHRAEEILMHEMPIIPLFFRTSKNMVRPYVQGIHENLLDMHPLSAIRIDRDAQRHFQAQGDAR